jgi:imidazolonepropionase-like amidohydrolase
MLPGNGGAVEVAGGRRGTFVLRRDGFGGRLAGGTLLTNALLLDCAGGEPVKGASVVVDNGRIASVSRGGSGPTGEHDVVFGCAGMTLMPGLTDAHVEIGAVDVNILEQHRASTPTTSWR